MQIFFHHPRLRKNLASSLFAKKMEGRKCGANLDRGDVLEHFLRAYSGNVQRATEAAFAYGWSETNRVRFDRSVIVQPENGPQFVLCPECKQPP